MSAFTRWLDRQSINDERFGRRELLVFFWASPLLVSLVASQTTFLEMEAETQFLLLGAGAMASVGLVIWTIRRWNSLADNHIKRLARRERLRKTRHG